MLSTYVYMQINPYVLFVSRTFIVAFHHIIIYKVCDKQDQ